MASAAALAAALDEQDRRSNLFGVGRWPTFASMYPTVGMNTSPLPSASTPWYGDKPGIMANLLMGIRDTALQANQAMPWGGNDPSAIGIDTQAGTIDPSVMVPFASNVAGMAATGGMAMPKPTGALGIFGGKMAKTADLSALERAEAMAAQGMDRGAIWNETGWFQGVDGKWRFEIPDNAAKPLVSVERYPMNTLIGGSDKLRRDFRHPEAYAAYDFPHYLEIGRLPQQSGAHYAPEYRNGEVNYAGSIRARGPDDEVVRNTALHEMQHHVQDVEDFAKGSNASFEAAQIAAAKEKTLIDMVLAQTPPDVVARMNRYDELKTQWRGRDDIPQAVVDEVTAIKSDPAVMAAFAEIKTAISPMRSQGKGGALERGLIPPEEAFAQYRRVAGEVEARNVEARSGMTPEQRQATPPWMTQEFPDEDQIIRMSLK